MGTLPTLRRIPPHGASGQASGPGAVRPARPVGSLVWVHGAGPAAARAIAALARRMEEDDDAGISWLLTPVPAGPDDGLIREPHPGDATGAVRDFLQHWQPDLLIWMRGDFNVTLLSESDRVRVPRLMIDAESSALAAGWPAWRAGRRRALVEGFSHALAIDTEAAARLKRAGLPSERIEVTGRLEETALPMPCDDERRAPLAEALAHRPVWLAAGATTDEAQLLARAHRQASRRTHRLLLIIVPEDGHSGAAIARRLAEGGAEVALRSERAIPNESAQILVADLPGELGLWYRLAPVTFLGGTLEGTGGRDPYEPAAHGSAILHGPKIRPWIDNYQRLARAGATRSVQSEEDLGTAVEKLLAPDRAAAMAHAGWDTISATAEVTNRLIELIYETLDAVPEA